VRAHESAEVSPIQTFRHGFTHRLVARHLKIRLMLRSLKAVHILCLGSLLVRAPLARLGAQQSPVFLYRI
jgi:hypothetical protein